MTRPLGGLSLVEATGAGAPLGVQLAATLCGRLACDLGATVRRVERPDDALRALPPRLGQSSATHAFLNAGKTVLRCGAADEAALVADLCSGADAVVLDEGLHAACAPALGTIAHAVLAMAAGTGAPQSAFTVEALSGLLDIIGDPARAPLRLGGHQLAYAAGLAAFSGLMGALCGEAPGECVRVDMLEVGIWLNWKSVASKAVEDIVPHRQGFLSEWLVLPCADGFMVLVYQAGDWAGLCAAVDDARLVEARFQSPALRRANAAALNGILAEFFAGSSRAEVKEIALARRLPIGAVWSPAELLDDPQMTARHFFRTMELEGARVTVPRAPVLWNGAVPEMTAPEMGA